jgi:SAM-dependent methyltransferase
MTFMKWAAVIAVIGVAGGLTTIYAAFGAFLPWREDAEARRLLQVLSIAPGQQVAEIGAGSGRLTVALARAVGPAGRVFASDLNPARRVDIRARAASAGVSNVSVLDGAPADTTLPDGCCDAIVMRAVYHHIQDPNRFVASVARALRPGGRVAVIDFDPGTLWLHGGRPDGSRRPGHGVARGDAIGEFEAAGFIVRQQDADWSRPLWLVVFAPGAGRITARCRSETSDAVESRAAPGA